MTLERWEVYGEDTGEETIPKLGEVIASDLEEAKVNARAVFGKAAKSVWMIDYDNESLYPIGQSID